MHRAITHVQSHEHEQLCRSAGSHDDAECVCVSESAAAATQDI